MGVLLYGPTNGELGGVLVGFHSLGSSRRGNGVSDVSFDLRGVGLVDPDDFARTYRRATAQNSDPASPIDLLAYTTFRTPPFHCVRGLNG
jgi:hypothetical protein